MTADGSRTYVNDKRYILMLDAAGAQIARSGPRPDARQARLAGPDHARRERRVLRSAGLFTTRVLPLRVGRDTVCTVTATGTVTERSKPRKRKRAVSASLREVRAKVAAGDSQIVRLTLSRTQVAKLRRAMKGRRGLTVTLQIVAKADVGEPTAVSRRLIASG